MTWLFIAICIFDAIYKDATWTSTTAVDDRVVRSACSDGSGEVFGEFAIPFSTVNNPLIRTTKESPSYAPSSALSSPHAYCPSYRHQLICPYLTLPSAFQPLLPPSLSRRSCHRLILPIGASLIDDSGAPSWAGGFSSCSDPISTRIFALCPTAFASRPLS
jgi:hypothetical protein